MSQDATNCNQTATQSACASPSIIDDRGVAAARAFMSDATKQGASAGTAPLETMSAVAELIIEARQLLAQSSVENKQALMQTMDVLLMQTGRGLATRLAHTPGFDLAELRRDDAKP